MINLIKQRKIWPVTTVSLRSLGLDWLRKGSWGRATDQKRLGLGARNGVFRGRNQETA